MKVITDASAAGTSHEALAVTYKQLAVCNQVPVPGHIKSHHAAVFETLWGDPPKTSQGSIVHLMTGWYACARTMYNFYFIF